MRVLDPVEGHLVEFSVGCPDDVEALADGVAVLLAREEPFALALRGPADLDDWQALLWDARSARRRLRKMRPALAAWCEHVDVALHDPLAADPEELWLLGLAWGCETRAVPAA